MSRDLCAGRVQRIDAVLKELETGDLKLRVRALEVERAARRSSILQVWHPLLQLLGSYLCMHPDPPCLRHARSQWLFTGRIQCTMGPPYLESTLPELVLGSRLTRCPA